MDETGWLRGATASVQIALTLIALASPAAGAAASSASAVPPANGASAASKKAAPSAPVKRVDINSASRAELKTLPGIGDAEAAKIIAGRPYLSKAELVTKNVLPTGPYLTLKGQIVAMQKDPPKAKP